MKKTTTHLNFMYILFLFCLTGTFQSAGAANEEEMQLDSIIQYNNNIGENSRYIKTEYTYDLKQNPVLKISYRWADAGDGTSFWMYSRKEEMTYDDRNRPETEKFYTWNAYSGTWVGSDRNYKRYLYNAENDRIDSLYYYLWDGAAWREQYYKAEFTYGEDGSCVEILYKNLNGTGWDPAEKREYGYDENRNLISLVYYTMNSITQVWQPSDKDEYTYDGHGNVLTYSKFLYLMGSWIEGENYKLKHEYVYDENGNIISDITYRRVSGSWQIDTHYTYQYFYSPVSTNVKLLPYNEIFDTENALTDDYTLWDADGNGLTAWSWNAGSKDMKCMQKVDDDYLFTPALHLPVTHRYQLTFKARCDNADASGKLKVIASSAANPDQEIAVVLNQQEISNTEYRTFSGTFLVPQQANYYIGFCAYTADGSAIYLDDVSVEAEKPVGVPDKVVDLEAWPAEGGVNKVTLMFLIPTTGLDGMLINGVDGYVIMRDDMTEPVYKEETFQIRGDVKWWVDENAKAGESTYTVYTYNDFGNSDGVSVTVTVGVDYPGKIMNLRAEEVNTGVCKLTWEAPDKTATGEPMTPEGVTYNVYRYLGTADELIANVSQPAYTDSLGVSGSQVPVQYLVTAVNKAGEGLKTSTDVLLLGDPYGLPFTESFSDCTFENYLWTTIGIVGASSWGFTATGKKPDVMPQDNDGGMMVFTTLQFMPGNMSRLTSPKIDISQAVEPVLGFWMAHATNTDDGGGLMGDDALVIKISADNGSYEKIDSIFVKSGQDGWVKHSYSLDAYKGCVNIRLGFVGVVGRTNNIYLDNITVSDAKWSSASDIDNKQVRVYATGNSIRIESVENVPATLYTSDGKLIYSEKIQGNTVIPVQKGFYIVSVGQQGTFKVIVP